MFLLNKIAVSMYGALAMTCNSHLSWSWRAGLSALLPSADGRGVGSVIHDLEISGRKLIMVLFLKGNLRSYHSLTYGMVGFSAKG